MGDKKSGSDSACSGVEKSRSRTKRDERVHIRRLMQQSRPRFGIKPSSCPAEDKHRKNKQDPANRVRIELVHPWQHAVQQRIERLACSISSADLSRAPSQHHCSSSSDGMDKNMASDPAMRLTIGLQSQLPVLPQLRLVVLLLFRQHRTGLQRNFSAVPVPRIASTNAEIDVAPGSNVTVALCSIRLTRRILHPCLAGKRPAGGKTGTPHKSFQ